MTTPSIEARVFIHAAPSDVQAVYADVAGWCRWDPDTRAASLKGPFQPGSRGWLRPRQGLPVRMVLTEVAAGGGFTVECPVLGSRMRFEHVLTPEAGGVNVLHRVSFSGWLAGGLMRTVGRPLDQRLPVTLAQLKAYVEGRSSRSGSKAAPRAEKLA